MNTLFAAIPAFILLVLVLVAIFSRINRLDEDKK